VSSKLTYASLPIEIKKIANGALGLGFLRSLFSYSSTYHLMIKISDGAFIGFGLYHFEETVRTDGSKFVKGVIDCVVVDTPYRKSGFGTTITFGILRKMSAYGANRVEIVMKAPSHIDIDGQPGVPSVGSTQLLEALSFRHVRTIHDFYKKSSIQFGYDCTFCGNRPDTCKGLLYAIDA
jgi:ribosomal protein S18 acetylase RimI-like enzyme